ncbi:hypothetical protein HMPREF0548_1056 [Lactobacillus ultunensis DSM 16047]|uniref:Uncharacterized protein n=1 Tax=Lactobacillus ultunensis DSM 16047 TaxID=525365 RepID=C2EN10_9LACO|nr:hypothetical protein HMPREF0548_1056 [Lactobacillus ultunensis DSM 16047]
MKKIGYVIASKEEGYFVQPLVMVVLFPQFVKYFEQQKNIINW